MSTARGFTNKHITNILMFLTWGNLEASIPSNHAAFISRAHNMQLLFLNSRFGPHVPVQGKRRVARHFLLLPYPYCGVDPWVTDLITPLARSPARSMLSYDLYRMFLAGQQACPQGL
ncbi:MAG: hypothetical protein M0T73_12515 [Deltaproteobacteria bacterium]|nr:hypothetical protein [Deltaproteobacteria bacterium]